MKDLEQLVCPECKTENIEFVGSKHDGKNFALGLTLGAGVGVPIAITTLPLFGLIPPIMMGLGMYAFDGFYNPIEQYECRDCSYQWDYQQPKEYK